MLVLTRYPGEVIVIDGSIRVTVLCVQGDRVRLGIEAPPYVTVDRAEVHQRRQALADPHDVPPWERATQGCNATETCSSR